MKALVYGDYWCEEERSNEEWGDWSVIESFEPKYLLVAPSKRSYRISSEHSLDFETATKIVPGKSYWYVAIVSSDGDSFGHATGKHESVDVFESETDARAVEALIQSTYDAYKNSRGGYDPKYCTIEYAGQKYGISQIIGYFEDLEEIVVQKLECR